MLFKKKLFFLVLMLVIAHKTSHSSSPVESDKKISEEPTSPSHHTFGEHIDEFLKDVLDPTKFMREPMKSRARNIVRLYDALCAEQQREANSFMKTAAYNLILTLPALHKVKVTAQQETYVKSFETIEGFRKEATIRRIAWKDQFKTEEERKLHAAMKQRAQSFATEIEISKNNVRELQKASSEFIQNPQFKKLTGHQALVESMKDRINELTRIALQLNASIQMSRPPSPEPILNPQAGSGQKRKDT